MADQKKSKDGWIDLEKHGESILWVDVQAPTDERNDAPAASAPGPNVRWKIRRVSEWEATWRINDPAEEPEP